MSGESGQFRPVIDSRFSFADAAEAHRGWRRPLTWERFCWFPDADGWVNLVLLHRGDLV
jgi:hypothetical protein